MKSITLFLLGGVSSLQEEAKSPGREALMAGAGPLSSLVIGGICWELGRTTHSPETGRAILLYLGGINILLGVFNLLPGFPLDGGRVLRAALWKRSGNLLRATRGAARTGTALGYLMLAFGVVLAVLSFTNTSLSGGLLSGIWLGFLGWVLTQASQAAYAQTATEVRLASLPVQRLMTPPRGRLAPETSLRAAADEYFLPLHTRCLPVGDEHDPLAGVVCLADLRRTERERWADEHVSEVMTPRERLATVASDATAADAMHLMTARDVNQVAVMQDDALLGFVDRGRLLHYAAGEHHAHREHGHGRAGGEHDAAPPAGHDAPHTSGTAGPGTGHQTPQSS